MTRHDGTLDAVLCMTYYGDQSKIVKTDSMNGNPSPIASEAAGTRSGDNP